MRLTGGEHSGRLLRVPKSGLRPTQDKVRSAIFSSLAASIPDARVLDLFAGTGAMGLEAWSRGAAWVEWIESEPQILRTLRENLTTLGVPSSAGRVLASDVFRLLAAPCRGQPFDLVLADPPYADAQENGWQEKLAHSLVQNKWIRPSGIFVFETEGHKPLPSLPHWQLARDKTYGSTRVLIWMQVDT